jgi:HD-GYP domain-containing protein (c-di-GMP phosphodiesterase class II)
MLPETLRALVNSIEVKDLSTAAHTWRVVLYARAMAEESGIDGERLERITTGAALHDLGKLDIPAEILQKPGKLTDEEFGVIKAHAVLGHARLIAMGETEPLLLDLVRHHHERWDGAGYPDRLAGEAISVPARYFAVIDSFDAMTSRRPYRSTVGPAAAEAALTELRAGAGTRYWTQAVDLFTGLYRSGHISWIGECFNDAADAAFTGQAVTLVSRQRAQPTAP